MIQAIRRRQKNWKRNHSLAAPLRWLSAEPVRRAFPLVKTVAEWAVERVISANVARVPVPKAIAFDLNSIRRPWSSVLAIRIRLKW